MSFDNLFKENLSIINIGLESFHENFQSQTGHSIHLNWSPPASANEELVHILEKWKYDERVLKANKEALQRLLSASPVWIDIVIAKDEINLDKHTLLHAGPPITYETMSDPMKGAVIAALKYEQLASSDQEAERLLNDNKIKFEPNHKYGCVGPMTGIISCSMPLIKVKNETHLNYSYSTINEGAGDVARFGAHSDNTVKRLKWIETVLAPALKKLVNEDPINLKVIIAQALTMGDELHMRNNSSTSLLIKRIMASLTSSVDTLDQYHEIAEFITVNNDQFFLNFAMAAAKASADASRNIDYSTMVTAMARNGVNIGIQISGLKDRWFEAPASDVMGLYFPGYTENDANKDIGDSAIMETLGVGGFAMASAPAIVKLLGADSYNEALNYTNSMYDITLGQNDMYLIPNLDFKGTPTGIDAMKVVEYNLEPVINTAIASKQKGVGMIGAGVAKGPISMFIEALKAFDETCS